MKETFKHANGPTEDRVAAVVDNVGALVCPRCNDATSLRHVAAHVMFRNCENGPGQCNSFTIPRDRWMDEPGRKSKRTTEKSEDYTAEEIPARSDMVELWFRCENCGGYGEGKRPMRLRILQHWGRTLMQWVDTEPTE